MIKLPDRQESYWQVDADKHKYPTLKNDLTVDVAIVGGGITGLSTAYLLNKEGLKVAVVEKNTIGTGTTAKTTGKVTIQHGLIYADLSERLGDETARTYAQANQAAFDKMLAVIKKEDIDCDLERADNYVFTTDSSRITEFKDEAKAGSRFGLPVSFVTDSDLPFEISAAVKFTRQANFNAQKYVNSLAKKIQESDSYVFEHSNVTKFHDGKPAFINANGFKVTATYIIVATKIPASPLVARASYGLLEHPHTSYIVAGVPKRKLSGMYISPDKHHYSILPINRGRDQIILIGGENHTPGLRFPEPRYRKLAAYAKEYFGVLTIDYRWKAMDYLPYDDVPLVGKVYPWSQNLYTATGFKKWGLTTSMVAAMILRDIVTGQQNPWAEVFNSIRLKPITSIPHAIKNMF